MFSLLQKTVVVFVTAAKKENTAWFSSIQLYDGSEKEGVAIGTIQMVFLLSSSVFSSAYAGRKGSRICNGYVRYFSENCSRVKCFVASSTVLSRRLYRMPAPTIPAQGVPFPFSTLLSSSMRFFSHSSNAVDCKNHRKERWITNMKGMQFHAAGAAHEMEVGQLKSGEWACQFILCTTTWEGLEEGGGNSGRLESRSSTLETSALPLSNGYSLSLGKTKTIKKRTSSVVSGSSFDIPTTPSGVACCTFSSPLSGVHKRHSLPLWSECTAKDQLVVRCIGTESFVRAFYRFLPNGSVIVVDGQVTLNCEAVLTKSGLVKQHTEVRLMQDRLRVAADVIRILYCGPHQNAETVQGRIHQAIYYA